MIEFMSRPEKGRRYSHERLVRLSDAGLDGVLRLDGLARYLQDAATDDWVDSGFDPHATWVVRRTAVRVAEGGRWPGLGELVTVTTWCAGTGPAWAERRTDLEFEGVLMIQAVALWVSLDASGRPLQLGDGFHSIWGEAAAGRRVSGRVPAAPQPTNTTARPWTIRRSDLDVLGHVNNAAVWAAVSEVAVAPVAFAALTHHGSLKGGHSVTLLSEPGRVWLVDDNEVRVFAEITRLEN